MKKSTALALISLLFTFSTAAQAQSSLGFVTAPIDNLDYDASSHVLSVTGLLPTGCAASPQPMLLATAVDSVIELVIVAKQDKEICASAVGGAYALAFDIRSLKSNLVELNLDPDAVYQIQSSSGKFLIEVSFSEGPFHFSYASQHHVGKIFAVEQNGDALMTVAPEHNQVMVVKSPFIDLGVFVGQEVEVQGHALQAQTNIQSFPLNISGERAAKKTLLVTGINSTSL